MIGVGISIAEVAAIVTPDEGGGGGEPAWLPAGADLHIDYDNAHYWAGGAERVFSDLYTDTLESGVATGTQLLIDQFKIAGFTIRADFDAQTSSSNRMIAVYGPDFEGTFEIELSDNDIYATELGSGGFQAEFDIEAGRNIVAANWKADSSVVASANGAANKTSTAGDVPMGAFIYADVFTPDAFLNSITPKTLTVWSTTPKADAALVALSTP